MIFVWFWGVLKLIKTYFWLENKVRSYWTGTGGPPYIQVGPPRSDFRGPGAQTKCITGGPPYVQVEPQNLIILGLLKVVRNSFIKPVMGSVGIGPLLTPFWAPFGALLGARSRF